jgi:hypothetical protein
VSDGAVITLLNKAVQNTLNLARSSAFESDRGNDKHATRILRAADREYRNLLELLFEAHKRGLSTEHLELLLEEAATLLDSAHASTEQNPV